MYAHDDQAQQQAQFVQNAIDQKVDGIIVSLAKPEALKDVIGKAVKAGIPVVTVNSGSAQSAEYGALTHIGQDEVIAGEAVGTELTKRGRKKAVCVLHEQGNVGHEQRCAGAKKTFGGTWRTCTSRAPTCPPSRPPSRPSSRPTRPSTRS